MRAQKKSQAGADTCVREREKNFGSTDDISAEHMTEVAQAFRSSEAPLQDGAAHQSAEL